VLPVGGATVLPGEIALLVGFGGEIDALIVPSVTMLEFIEELEGDEMTVV
jgi:hypothetical protein